MDVIHALLQMALTAEITIILIVLHTLAVVAVGAKVVVFAVAQIRGECRKIASSVREISDK